MFRDRPASQDGLVSLFVFDAESIKTIKIGDGGAGGETVVAVDKMGERWCFWGVGRA
jgi:hypothetical protein